MRRAAIHLLWASIAAGVVSQSALPQTSRPFPFDPEPLRPVPFGERVPAGPVPWRALVCTDSEGVRFLRDARKLLAGGKHEEAIRILAALVENPVGFAQVDPAADPKDALYVGSTVMGARLLAGVPKDVLARHRDLYDAAKLAACLAEAAHGRGGPATAPTTGQGARAMGIGEIVPAPLWCQRPGRISRGDDLTKRILAGADMYAPLSRLSPSSYRSSYPSAWQFSFRSGHLYLNMSGARAPDQAEQPPVLLPALVHPLVVGEQVLLRLDDKVVACDLWTGRRAWDSFGSLPMARRPDASPRTYFYSGARHVGDLGRYALTVGGGKVFTVYDFLPRDSSPAIMRAENVPNVDDYADNSALAALSLMAEGSLLWRVGRGIGASETVRQGKFLSAPAYSEGRLYVLVNHLQGYRLVCLDAQDGAMVWEMPVAEVPAPSPRYGIHLGEDRSSIASPPTVADGRVYVTTNTGAIAAFHTTSGRALWARQYPTTPQQFSPMGFARVSRGRPPNPIVVARARVICLPADSSEVFALDADSGEMLWRAPRRGECDLTGIDDDRVLLSGPGLVVVSTANGALLHEAKGVADVHGRPAVAGGEVLASGAGRILRLDIEGRGLSIVPLKGAHYLLGNLAVAEGGVVAANALGVCMYMDGVKVRTMLTARLKAARPADRPGLLCARAELALKAGRSAEAVANLTACQKLLVSGQGAQLGAWLAGLLYQAHVAAGNQAREPDAMREAFGRAQPYAATPRDKAELLLRLAKADERAGKPEQAVALARQIAQGYGETELTDVPVGLEAVVGAGSDALARTVRGEKLARDYIAALIQIHGRACYAKFDAEARAALDRARATGQPGDLLDVAKRWPNCRWMDEILLAAAEALYRRTEADMAKADEHLAEARRLLHRVSRMADSPLGVSARVGLAAIYARGGWQTSARLECERLREKPPDTPVAFADIKGRLADVLKMLERDGATPPTSRPAR